MDERNKNCQGRVLRILNEGDKEALIDELCDAIKWVRELNLADWVHVITMHGSLREFVRRSVEMTLAKDLEAKEEER